MPPESTTKHDVYPRPLGDQIEGLCEQFAADLRQGKSPRIEELLPRVHDAGRVPLLRKLIAIEIAFDQSLGKSVDFASYDSRFPEDKEAIGELRAEGDFQQSTDDSPTITFRHQLKHGIGNYELLHKIGRGGSGEVYAARHTRLDRRDAVKVLADKHAADSDVRKRFLREMQSIGRLKHPHIVQAYDAGESNGALYLAMELVDGPDVELLARRVSPFTVANACEIVRQAALGLQHIFEHGLVHRDLKPSNLLLSSSGVKIADLGLVLLRDAESTADDRLTGTLVVMGTADYIAPEQTEGAREVDIRADLYSLGCTLYRLLAGHAPFAFMGRGLVMQKLHAHAHDPVPDISTQRPDIPKEVLAILEKLLAKNREDRFSEPRQLATALAPYCGEANLSKLVEAMSTECALPARRQVEHVPLPLQPSPTKVTVAPVRRFLPQFLGVTLVLVMCVVAFQNRGQWNKPDDPVSPPHVPKVPPPVPANFATPQIVLNVAPAKNSVVQVEEPTNKLHVVSNDLLMVKLGTLDRKDSVLEIAMEMGELKSPSGHAGVFVGYRNQSDHEQSLFQLIRLQTWSDGQTYSRRTLSVFHPTSPGIRDSREVHYIPIQRHLRVNTLQLKIMKGRLSELIWNGETAGKWDVSDTDAPSGDNDITGFFGVYADEAVAVFSDFLVDGERQEFKP